MYSRHYSNNAQLPLRERSLHIFKKHHRMQIFILHAQSVKHMHHKWNQHVNVLSNKCDLDSDHVPPLQSPSHPVQYV